MRGVNTILLTIALLVNSNSFAVSPAEREIFIVDSVKMVELNHFYDEHCRLIFDQFLFYDIYPGHGETLIVREWRLAKTGRKEYTFEERVVKEAEAQAEYLKANKMNTLPEHMSDNKFWEPEWVGDPDFQFNYHPNHIIMIDRSSGPGYDPVKRKIYFQTFSESWTQYDPELINREIVSKDKRITFRNYKNQRAKIPPSLPPRPRKLMTDDCPGEHNCEE